MVQTEVVAEVLLHHPGSTLCTRHGERRGPSAEYARMPEVVIKAEVAG
jgi:hypothetical protein